MHSIRKQIPTPTNSQLLIISSKICMFYFLCYALELSHGHNTMYTSKRKVSDMTQHMISFVL